MTKPNSTEIIVVLDRSGSMSSIKKDMEGGFNEFIEKQKAVPGECKVSLFQFDDEVESVYTAVPLEEVPPLSLEPRGMTALYDAVAKATDETGARLARMNEDDRPSKVIVLVITDGQENKSKNSSKSVMDRVQHQRTKYSWEYTFLGADESALAVAAGIGISTSNAVAWKSTQTGSRALFDTVADGFSMYRLSNSSKMDGVISQKAYTANLNNRESGSVNR